MESRDNGCKVGLVVGKWGVVGRQVGRMVGREVWKVVSKLREWLESRESGWVVW